MFDYAALAEAVAGVLRARRRGEAAAPERLALPVSGGVLLCMPATDGEIAVVKTITVHPANRDRPVIQGEITVLAAATGRPAVTARRTAAVSLLAAKFLSPADDGPLLVIGAGVQARAHVEAFWQGLGARDITLVSRTRSRAEALATELKKNGISVKVSDDAAGEACRARRIVTATTSREPVFPDTVRDDVFVSAVGAFTPEAAEVPASLVARATLYADDLDAVRIEAGDFLRARVDWATVTPLDALLDAPPPVTSGPVVFKSVGHALFDLAAAKLAFAAG